MLGKLKQVIVINGLSIIGQLINMLFLLMEMVMLTLEMLPRIVGIS